VYDERSGQQPTGTILQGLCLVGHGRAHARKQKNHWFSLAKSQWFQSRAQGGVTQLTFCPRDYRLYSTSRRSDAVLVWDLRMLSGRDEYQTNPICGYGSFATKNDTNQRIEFDVSKTGESLFVGGRDRCVRVYDTQSGECTSTICDFEDCANGVSCHTELGTTKTLLAVATGSRRFPSEEDLDADSTCSDNLDNEDEIAPGCLRLYSL
jgi:WD40 repeat protein